MCRQICKVLAWVVLFFPLTVGGLPALGVQEEHVMTDSVTTGHESGNLSEDSEPLNPGDFIFDHIKDAHEWHIMTIGHTHVSIPLPVIVYSKTKGLNVFMSSKFKHGQAVYKEFRLETTGENKNKILEEDGSKPLDLSITKNIAAMFFGVLLILWIFLSMGKAYRKNPVSAPSGLQSWFEPVIVFLRDEVIRPAIGPKYERYMPYLLTLFFFIWINNMLGLIPIPPAGANLTGNIAVTMVLAVFTFVITNISGTREYWKHIFNTPGVPWWLKLPIPIMPLVEVLGVITKPVVLMIRLFANITAGHIVVMGFITLIYIFAEMSAGLAYGVSIVSVLFDVFIFFLELLIAFIQAFIFTFLSSIYFGLAVVEHHEEHEKEHA
jgi:F-type H+-transporting ATPase subunit a